MKIMISMMKIRKMEIYKFLVISSILVLTSFIEFSSETLSPSDKVKKSKELKPNTGPQDRNVFDKNLVEEEPSAKDILLESGTYYKNTEMRLFNGTVLGYVTPWNNHGYDVAKTWAKKFDIISPVWLQIHRNGDKNYKLSGTHDIDLGWMKDVRKAGGRGLKFFPRILLENFRDADYSKLFTHQHERRAAFNVIIDACILYKFDGIVLEIWHQLSGRINDELLFQLVIEMATALKEKGLELILVIPPFRQNMLDMFSSKHFERLYSHVYAFSLMTYDFSSIEKPGANAPLYWMKSSVEHIVPNSASDLKLKRRKILMGLNMYGNDYTPDGGNAIVNHQFLDLVKYVKKRLTFDERDVENFFEIRTSNGRHFVFYPTLHSINERLKLAAELSVGISIWELGQGLDYFYDLF